MENIYLDYAATTPVDPRVLRVMQPYFAEKFGNPSSIHSFGQLAQGALDLARESIAQAIGADFRELLFTGSATEANNLVLRGVITEMRRQGTHIARPRIITSAIEHESVLETCRALEQYGVEVVYVPVNKRGVVDLKKLRSALTPETALVSVMYANNEIGAIQPLAEISKIIRNFRESRIKNQESGWNSKLMIHDSRFLFPLFHTDAVQALQFLECNVLDLGLDFMTFSAHKIYGPKGVGALYARRDKNSMQFLTAQMTGGSQEFGLRSGTQNVPLIVGFERAISLIRQDREKEAIRIAVLRQKLWEGIKKIEPKAQLNGFAVLPNILNIYFPGRDAHEFVIQLDLLGVAISAGSACGTRMLKTSHVLKALGLSTERAKSSVRFSLGRPTTEKEITEVLKRMKSLFVK